MEKSLRIVTGVVKEIHEHNRYLVELKNNGSLVEVSLSGKARLYFSYDIFIGEEVQIELSPYDLTRGRIEPRGWSREKPPKPSTVSICKKVLKMLLFK